MKIILERNEEITKEQLLELLRILREEATNGSSMFDLSPEDGERRKRLSLVVIPETFAEIWEEHKEIRKLQGQEIRTEDDVEEFIKMYHDIIRAKAKVKR